MLQQNDLLKQIVAHSEARASFCPHCRCYTTGGKGVGLSEASIQIRRVVKCWLVDTR
jgi:hypothetical protein